MVSIFFSISFRQPAPQILPLHELHVLLKRNHAGGLKFRIRYHYVPSSPSTLAIIAQTRRNKSRSTCDKGISSQRFSSFNSPQHAHAISLNASEDVASKTTMRSFSSTESLASLGTPTLCLLALLIVDRLRHSHPPSIGGLVEATSVQPYVCVNSKSTNG